MLNRQGRPTAPGAAARAPARDLHAATRRCCIEEPLIFEIGRTDTTGVDLDEPAKFASRLGGLERTRRSACPASPSRRRCATTCASARRTTPSTPALFPLGSCTMKHNPRLNEKMARLPGFADIHPLQPESTVQGALELIDELAHWLKTLTGMPAVAMSPEGRRAWRALRHDGDQGRAGGARRQARSASWCRNPRTAPTRRPRPARLSRRGRPGARRRPRRSRRGEGEARPRCRRDHADQPQHLRAVRARYHRDRRRGPRRRRLSSIATAPISTPSSAGCAPAISASTPCTSICTRRSRRRTAAAAPAPARSCCPRRWRRSCRCRTSCMARTAACAGRAARSDGGGTPRRFGRLNAFHGQMGMFMRALAYMMSHGADGLRQAPRTRC